MRLTKPGVVTVTLNAAIDQTLECPGFTAGAVNRVVAETRTPGGKGINVAAFLAGGTRPVTATGFLGEDTVPLFETLFRERGIQDRCLRLPGSSRVNIKVVDRTGGAVTDLNLPGLRVPEEALGALMATLDALAEENGCFVLSGSVPAGVPASIYATLTERLRARGAVVAVDTSGAPLRHAVAAKPDFVKPNAHELEELVERPLRNAGDIARAARELHATGIGLVVVSLGADGALFVSNDGAWRALPPPVEVASTVGAGDALVAGVLASRLEGHDLETCARRSTAFAAAKLAKVGPVPPAPERVAELLCAVRMHPLGTG
ncbi:6-phosphofructokinase [Corallococcus coralloides DSM 2259]|uniref:1-phosphofructokinase n=1 Tax=Corallococcus coralloides (strain ATCC 25202 / DSM 2259 / NBRC 100086 / M2) TaxID=1144275 RepID=H8MYA3_CORCM|nr:1-phosphofructokinase [Corallococcus coralloides]AFE09788.1 6-phosphofructokinase [Corallococcus coralloides DSM 2259]